MSSDRTARFGALPPATLAGFIAATLAAMVISFLSYRSLEYRTETVHRFKESLQVSSQLEALKSTLADAETGQRGYLLTGNPGYLEPFEKSRAALPSVLEETRRAMGDNPAQLRELELVERLARTKMDELGQTVSLRRSERTAEAMAVVNGNRGKDLMDEIRAGISRMREAENAALLLRDAEWTRATELSSAITWAGAVSLLFLIAVAAVLSSRDFRAQQIETWLRTGQNKLGMRMQGEHEEHSLGDAILSVLARYVGAQMGALYFADGEGLRRMGAFAIPEDAKERGATVSGLTEQAMREHAPMLVSNVPEDYFSISSGLGRSRPRHLLLSPATVAGRARAVVELGFFQPVAPHVVELLRRVGESIGMALRSAKDRRELELLLEETRRQTEELQTQQEELRSGNEELERQAQQLKASQAQLETQHVELEQINAHLEEQTNALALQRDDLTRAHTELARANTYKSEFLANMSHELRTPLNSSLILAKLLSDNREGNLTAEQIKFAQTIYSAGNDLLTLINDILDLSKIEAGKLDIRPENVTLTRLIDDLRATFEPIAAQKRLELTTDLDAGLPAAMFTDPTRLQQVLKNLLSNALKFTERGGVSLHVRRARPGWLAFDVKDTGIGIAENQLEIIFEPFRQADGTTNRKYGGTGLGLSISRDLARLLGGELSVASAPGRGSTFTLLIQESAPAAAGAAPHETTTSRRTQTSAPVAATRAAAAKSAPAPSSDDRDRITPESRTILAIEDDDRFAGVLRDLAHELDFQFLRAHTAEEGLELAERHLPSGIVLDVGLPDRSGLSVLDSLKRRPSTRHIPVHMMSVEDHAQTALAMGAAGYAIKPVQRERLVDAMKRLEAKFTQKIRRVLIVEDDMTHREGTSRLLAADDVETVAVGTAAEALERLGSSTFDCMVLDLSLPDRTGFDLLEEMSRREECSFPPVIVYTGRVLTLDEEQTLRRFSSSIIIKGARSPERLLDEVTLFLHQVESDLPPDRQRMLRDARHRDAVFDGRRVLVVEDDVRNIFALSRVLEPTGAKVEIARNGKEALKHLEDKPGVDLVLMDVMMPEMDGLQATEAIRKRPELARLPIIALTAKAMADDRERCIAAGANDYIAKPLDVDKLLSLVRVWMPK